jgi:gamma-glutamyltranspeptidase/glutathione hydrolase
MPPPFTTRPELRGTFGAIASTHWLASAVGMAVLERGGNAFDAAVAAGFVLQIVEPHLNGPGGEVPIILKRADADAPIVICGQGPYPAGATLEHFSALGINQVPGTGLLPSVVPGAFDAWMLLLRDHGTWRLRDVLEYALHYAQNGFPVLPRIAASILAAKDFFAAEWPTSAAIWCPGGAVPAPGTFFSTPRIAATYRRIVAEAESAGSDRVAQIERARETFYRGFVADAVDRFYASQELMDSTGQRNRGVLCGDDLASFRATVEPTTSFVYRGLRVHKTGPWGQGPAFLQSLSLLDGFDLAALDPAGDAFVHTLVECMKLAYADREVFYGDPRFVDVPLATLLSDENPPRWSSGRARLPARRTAWRGCWRWQAPRPLTGSVPASRPSPRCRSNGATRFTSMSLTASATCSRQRHPAVGCRARRRFPSSALRSRPVARSAGSSPATPRRCGRARARAPR